MELPNAGRISVLSVSNMLVLSLLTFEITALACPTAEGALEIVTKTKH